MIAHGAANFMHDRLYANSDPYRVHVCDECGMIAIANLRKQTFDCGYCDNKSRFSQVSCAGMVFVQIYMHMYLHLPTYYIETYT
ncbi:hypothetical protein EON63_16645 [archaeon]|nr:MAG: hypothetical protein EON63_16645 [archaeon]